jgi:hypothetical protein
MKAFALGTMLLCGALAACSSSGDDGTGTGTGSGSGGGDGDGGSDAGSGGSNSTPTSTGATPTTTAQSSASGGTCSVGEFFGDATCDGCLNASCCAQAEACIADFQAGGDQCILQDGTGTLNQDGTVAQALYACLDTNCATECGGGGEGICDGPVAYQDPELSACIEGSCCTEHNACWGAEGENEAACQACLEAGGGGVCDGLLDCAQEAGCLGYPICDSIVALEDETIAECMGTNCCQLTKDCFGTTQATFDACEACLVSEEPGPLCSGLIACDTENTCGFITEG